MRTYNYKKQVEKWDVLEVTVGGHSDRNPFVDYEIHGTFTGKHETVTVETTDRSVWQIPIILPMKTERHIIPSVQPVMCGICSRMS